MKRLRDVFRRDWYIWVMIAAAFLCGILLYPRLPAEIPVHWDGAGRVNGSSSRAVGTFAMPCMAAASYLLLCVIPLIDPRSRNYPKFKSSYQMIKSLTVTVFLITQACILLTALKVRINVSIVIGAALSVFFILLGNVMGRFRHNYFVGIRTPWTLANEEVWRKTHRLAGPVWVLGGIADLALTLFAGHFLMTGTLLVAAVMVLLPCVYSYLLFRQIGGEKH